MPPRRDAQRVNQRTAAPQHTAAPAVRADDVLRRLRTVGDRAAVAQLVGVLGAADIARRTALHTGSHRADAQCVRDTWADTWDDTHAGVVRTAKRAANEVLALLAERAKGNESESTASVRGRSVRPSAPLAAIDAFRISMGTLAHGGLAPVDLAPVAATAAQRLVAAGLYEQAVLEVAALRMCIDAIELCAPVASVSLLHKLLIFPPTASSSLVLDTQSLALSAALPIIGRDATAQVAEMLVAPGGPIEWQDTLRKSDPAAADRAAFAVERAIARFTAGETSIAAFDCRMAALTMLAHASVGADALWDRAVRTAASHLRAGV